jgi:putative transposase
MIIERETGEVFNLKRIARVKKKYGLVTQKRKISKVRVAKKDEMAHATAPNLLQQNFDIKRPREVFSTDVTYLSNYRGQRAYLSAVKDLGTNEIVGYEVSLRNDLEFVMNSIKKSLSGVYSADLIIHSDQGFQYTNECYRKYLEEKGVTQSMSRRGNCLDNAPIESFFGHMKDELKYRDFKTLKDLQEKVDKYMNYYNFARPQWGLKRKTPVEYRSLIA